MFGLAYLLGTTSIEEFRQNHWGKTALLIKGNQNRFENIFGWQDVNHIAKFARNSMDGLKLVYEKKALAPSELEHLDRWLHKGATLVCNNVNDIDPVVDRFTSVLEKDLNTSINVNAYTSCPSKQGFDLHHDQHDVFIVQTEGTKRWVVYEPTFMYPLHELGASANHEKPDSEPYVDVEMNKGDVLYIPRGHWHYAVAVTPSMHLTVGPVARSASQFLSWLARQLMKNEELFRQDFPLIDSEFLSGKTPNNDFDEHMDNIKNKLEEIFESDNIKETYARYCMTSNPLKKDYQYPESWILEEDIQPDTKFVFPADQKVLVRYDNDQQNAVLYCRGFTLVLNQVSERFVNTLLSDSTNIVTGRKLMDCETGGSWEPTKSVLMQLFRNGALILAIEE